MNQEPSSDHTAKDKEQTKTTGDTCLPESELEMEPLLLQSIDTSDRQRISVILDEFIRGFRFLQSYAHNSVSFFGSSRTQPEDDNYEHARRLAGTISQAGYSIVTGGGPGIMEAANRGAFEADGNSLGITIKLPNEQATNDFVKDSVSFYYFFVRKVMLAFAAKAYIFFPGGFGTMDELFELLTLIQTHKVPKVPIILVDDGHWEKLDEFIQKNLLEQGSISPQDTGIYTITSDDQKVLELIAASDRESKTEL